MSGDKTNNRGTSYVYALKGKGNIERKYIYQDITFKAKKFDTFDQNGQLIRKLLEFKYLETNCQGGHHF